jgi:hypothetical protein
VKYTKKELVQAAISEMNVDKLFTLLNDNFTFYNVSKKEFLENLENEVFKKFKNNGDTFLSPFHGKCTSKSCDNKGCNGIAFVGNKSKAVINLVFIETLDEYSDIFDCFSFKTTHKIKSNITYCILPLREDDFDDVPF